MWLKTNHASANGKLNRLRCASRSRPRIWRLRSISISSLSKTRECAKRTMSSPPWDSMPQTRKRWVKHSRWLSNRNSNQSPQRRSFDLRASLFMRCVSRKERRDRRARASIMPRIRTRRRWFPKVQRIKISGWAVLKRVKTREMWRWLFRTSYWKLFKGCNRTKKVLRSNSNKRQRFWTLNKWSTTLLAI